MKKAINMQAQVQVGAGPDAAQAVSQELPRAFAAANPGMQLTVKRISPPDAAGNATIALYIEGEQEPAADFNALAGSAFNKAVANLGSTRALGAAPLAVQGLREVEDEDEDAGLILPPQQAGAAAPPVPAAPAPIPAAPPASTAASSAPADQGAAASPPPAASAPPPAPPAPSAERPTPAPPPARRSSGRHRHGR